MRWYSLGGTRPLNTSASVPRLMPLYMARTSTSWADGGAIGSSRISPRPGTTVQKARAVEDELTLSPWSLVIGVWSVPGSWLSVANANQGPSTRDHFDTRYNPRDSLAMTSMAWQIPRAPLRASVIGVYAAGFAGVVVLAALAQQALGLGAAYPLKAAVVFGVVVLIGVGFVQSSHPFTRFGAANAVTTGRAAGVALIAALVGEPGMGAAVPAAVGSVLVTLLDGVDGRLARQSGMASAFGARFDMEVDALLILALSILGWSTARRAPGSFSRDCCDTSSWPPAGSCPGCAVLFRQAGGVRRSASFRSSASASSCRCSRHRRPAHGGRCAGRTLLYSFLIDIVWLWRAR